MKYETMTPAIRRDVVIGELTGAKREHYSMELRKDAGEEPDKDAVERLEARVKRLQAELKDIDAEIKAAGE